MIEQDPERALAFSYAPRDRQAALSALFALDATLGQILRTTREPLVGQMRLTWWHAALSALDTAPPPAQPVLQALADEVVPRGVSGVELAAMIDGWEALLGPDPIADAELLSYARGRGGLFGMAGRVLGCAPGDPCAAAGEGWALADLARNLGDANDAGRALALASGRIRVATRHRWSPAGRALGALAHGARMDLAMPLGQAIARGSPGRVARLALHRLTGR